MDDIQFDIPPVIRKSDRKIVRKSIYILIALLVLAASAVVFNLTNSSPHQSAVLGTQTIITSTPTDPPSPAK